MRNDTGCKRTNEGDHYNPSCSEEVKHTLRIPGVNEPDTLPGIWLLLSLRLQQAGGSSWICDAMQGIRLYSIFNETKILTAPGIGYHTNRCHQTGDSIP